MASTKARSLASKVLGLDEKPGQASSLSTATLQSFQSFLDKNAHDDNCILTPGDGNGFGAVTCMEENCYMDIALTPAYEYGVADGGKSVGIGSLRAYSDHIDSHPTHKAMRNKRIGVQQIDRKPSKPKAMATLSPNKLKRSGSSSLFNPQAVKKQPQSPSFKPVASSSSSSTANRAVKTENSIGSIIRAPGGGAPPAPVRAGPVAHGHGAAVAAANNLAANNAHGGFDATKRNNIVAAIQQIATAIRAGENKKALLEAKQNKTMDDWDEYDAVVNQLLINRATHEQYTQAFKNIGGDVRLLDGVPAAVGLPNGGGGGGGAMDEDERVIPQLDDNPDDYTIAQLGTTEVAEFLKGAFHSSFANNESVDEARTKLKLATIDQPVDGMVCGLLPHQLIGVAWMVGQEDSKLYGGVLADEMGLGKTVQTIATMCFNMSGDPKVRNNLIVAPLALLEQWKAEIEDKCEDNMFSIHIYHGPNKVKSAKELRKFDVVLTTYQTLALEWPDKVAFEKKQKKKEKAKEEPGFVVSDSDDSDDGLVLKKPGPIFQIEWFRVILDEAQAIRNRATRISRAVSDLESLFRWCLTGTPMTNSLADFYGLLRFLRIKPWFEWKEFSSHIAKHEKKRPAMAGKRMQAIFQQVGKRRKITDKIGDQPLIKLPEMHVHLHEMEFSEEEREIYDFVQTQAQIKFNKFLKAGTVLKNYSTILVMLLRLRQLCLHPCLIVDAVEDPEVNEKKLQDEWDRAIDAIGNGAVRRIKDQRMEIALERRESELAGDEAEELDDCPVCMEPFTEGMGEGIVTRCGHTFCRGCIEDVLERDLENHDEDTNYHKDERPCPTCRGAITQNDIFTLAAFDPTDQEVEEAAAAKQGKGRMLIDDSDDEEVVLRAPSRRTSSKKTTTRVVDSDDEQEREEEQEKTKDKAVSRSKTGKPELPPWMSKQAPSTKMLWVYDELQRIQEENPEEKVIIISQFTSALDLLDEYLHDKGIRVCRYQGDMSRHKRAKSIKALMKGKKTNVMLMSLKCGGVGLNLTRANRVISFDLAWSPAVESQAWGRVHRIGQTRESHIERLTINSTVEQRLLAIQAKKQVLSDASLGEGKGKKLGRLTVNDLANLFGLNGRGLPLDEDD